VREGGGEVGKLELVQALAGCVMSSSATSAMMGDEDDGGGGRGVREGDLERLMRSLSEDMSSQGQSQGHQQDWFVAQAPGFSQAQPSFLLELLSMPAPGTSAGWSANPNVVGVPDAAPGLHSGVNLHGFPGTQQQRAQEVLWDALPDFPSWFPAQDGLQELGLPAPGAWNDHPAVSTTMTKTSTHSSGVSSVPSPVNPRSTSPSSPARLNSAASTLPSTPNSSLSSGSVSDAAAEEDHSHHDRASSARPAPSQPQAAPGPSGSSTAKRKTPDRTLDDDEIQSLKP
jgi:hypothetical protein